MVNCLTKSKSKQPAKPIVKKQLPKLTAKKQAAKPAIKKLKPASITAQKAWQGFPAKLKKELRKSLPDTDKDRVPDGFDCKPRNKRKQESFLPVDAAYVASAPVVVPDKYLGSGACGDVYTVKGNRHMVVKVPRGYIEHGNYTPSDRRYLISRGMDDLLDEFELYEKYDLEHEALFTPTKFVNLEQNDIGLSAIGLLRPRVRTLQEGWLNDRQLELLRRQLISISHKGLELTDGLQIGVDKSGKPLLFDLGWVGKTTPSKAFQDNGSLWRYFLDHMTTKRNDPYMSMRDLLAKYGDIKPNEYY